MKVTPNPSRLREGGGGADFHFVIRLEMTLGLHIRKT